MITLLWFNSNVVIHLILVLHFFSKSEKSLDVGWLRRLCGGWLRRLCGGSELHNNATLWPYLASNHLTAMLFLRLSKQMRHKDEVDDRVIHSHKIQGDHFLLIYLFLSQLIFGLTFVWTSTNFVIQTFFTLTIFWPKTFCWPKYLFTNNICFGPNNLFIQKMFWPKICF